MGIILSPDIKHEQWPVDPSLVAPEWWWFWNNVRSALVFWEGGGVTYDYAQRKFPIEEVGSSTGTIDGWGSSVLGRSQSTRNNAIHGSKDHWKLGTIDKILPNTGAASFFLVFETLLSSPGSIQPRNLGTLTLDATEISAHIPWSDNVIYFDHGGKVSGTTRVNTGALTWAKNQVYKIALVAGPSGMSIWRDGIKEASHSTAATRTSSTKAFYYNAGDSWTTDHNPYQKHIAFYAFNIELTAEQVLQLTRDSFGPFRMADDYAAWRTVAAGPLVRLSTLSLLGAGS